MVIANAPRPTSTITTQIDTLDTRIRGTVIRPRDAAYDAVREVHNADTDARPAIIVRAAGTQDVVEAVRYARSHGLDVAVRSGGHSLPGYGMADRALVVDMSDMRDFTIDPGRQTLSAQPGVTTGELVPHFQQHGLILSTGDVTTVGLGGLTLGGGIGWLVRKHGLSIDSLISAEVVTADGVLRVASERENADLFWAVRGGGGNFGIVTRLEFRLHPLPGGMIYGGAIVLPPTTENVRKWAQFSQDAPDELTMMAGLMYAPPAPFVPEDKVGEPVFAILLAYAGDPADGERVIAPLRELGEPIGEFLGEVPYETMYVFTAEAAQRRSFDVRSILSEELPVELIERLIEWAPKAPSPGDFIQIRAFGGAMARVPKDATAFAHRDKRFMVTVIGEWDEPVDAEPNHRWVQDTWAKVQPFGSGVYANFLMNEGRERIHEAYPGETYRRLADIKRKYDPNNMFRFNQNILAGE